MESACQVGTDGPSRKDVRGIGNGTVDNGHGVEAEEVEEWSNDKEEDLPNGHSAPPGAQQVDEQNQQQVPIIRWEGFLPVKTLRVLLVENDDSTRQVVSALLRKCCYEVIPAENGLHAWKYLEDLQNHIDLVLTEVAMPCLSGIGLLSTITCHKICKDVPVIMMSSNDSMSTVFKCLSKGAVDFLVKPIRKNELKNLWQHVWRRCHSSSGSESGIQTQKCAKPKAGDEYENNSGSNHEDGDDDFSIGLNARDGSDKYNGSGTQGCNLALHRKSKRLHFFDLQAFPGGTRGGAIADSFVVLYNDIQRVVEANRTGENAGQFMIMIDDVSLLEVATHGSVDDVLDFLHYCVTLTSDMNCLLVVLIHEYIYPSEEGVGLLLHLRYIADLVTKAAPLSTRLAADVHGQNVGVLF